MLTNDTAVMLARYSDWADQVLFRAIGSLPEGAAASHRGGVFGSMIGTLNHNYQVDLIWKAHLLGTGHGFSSRRDVLHPQLDVLAREQSQVDRWYIEWAGQQTPERLSERLPFKFVSGLPGEMTRGAMFLHVVNHKTYHRGWVAQMFFGFGVDPPQMDLSVFLCE